MAAKPFLLGGLIILLTCLHFQSINAHSEHHEHHDHHRHIHDERLSKKKSNEHIQCTDDGATWSELFIPSSKRESFWQGILATVFIGAAPILCIKFVSTKDYWLKILLSFASGGLMGDVFLHLLPEAISMYESANHNDHQHHHNDDHHHIEHGHSEVHSHNSGHSLLGMHILFGFGIFFILEKLFHEFGSANSHSHSHSDALHKKNDDMHSEVHYDDARKHAITLLSICADASHNFTDGLTIAASFLVSFRMGMIQTFSILIHEIPHEIGDYAILLENGVSVKMAMFIQMLTACACLLGTVLGFVLENTQIGTKWIIPFTAGGFIYISCVQVMPTLVEKKYGMTQSALHVLFFAFGIAMMVFVSYIEENAEKMFDE